MKAACSSLREFKQFLTFGAAVGGDVVQEAVSLQLQEYKHARIITMAVQRSLLMMLS